MRLAEQAIKETAELIRIKAKGTFLYGDPINMDDIDSLMVAAYWLGKNEEDKRRRAESKLRGSLETDSEPRGLSGPWALVFIIGVPLLIIFFLSRI